MSAVLARWNGILAAEAESEILPCCGAKAWARGMVARRPLADEAALVAASDEVWRRLTQADWMEAFASHPRIGERRQDSSARSGAWSTQEQQGVDQAEDSIKAALALGNQKYEERFGRIFIVFATGKSATEMLAILQRRLQNDDATELSESAEQLRQITHIRLKKWLLR